MKCDIKWQSIFNIIWRLVTTTFNDLSENELSVASLGREGAPRVTPSRGDTLVIVEGGTPGYTIQGDMLSKV